MKLRILVILFSILAISGKVKSQGCIGVSDSCNGGLLYCGPWELSRGIYRVPYSDATTVKITNDHFNHCPRGRIDMIGTVGEIGGQYHIVAAADGWIRAIVDNHNTQCDCSVSSCSNNYVWIEHPNGEWTKYTHMKKNSVTNQGHFIGEFVTAGTYLGNEGNVGCASGQHLHFEVAQPVDTNTLWFSVNGGYIDSAMAFGLAKNVIPVICSVTGNIFQEGQTYIAIDCPGSCSGSLSSSAETISIGEYEVALNDNTISNNDDFVIEGFGMGLFQAASSVTLKVGFESHSNSDFTARIGNCDESPLKPGNDASEADDDSGLSAIDLKVFPNPASESITIRWFAQNESAYKISLMDLTGKQLEQFAGKQQVGEVNHLISVSALAEGLYFVEVENGSEKLIRKLIVHH